MPAMGAGSVGNRPYTVTAAIAARAIEGVTMPELPSIVYVVDNDVSVRESLELLIGTAGWRPETQDEGGSLPDLVTMAARLGLRSARLA